MQRKVFRIPYMYSTEKRQAENYVIYRKILQTHTIGKSCTYHLCRIIIDYVFNGEQSSWKLYHVLQNILDAHRVGSIRKKLGYPLSVFNKKLYSQRALHISLPCAREESGSNSKHPCYTRENMIGAMSSEALHTESAMENRARYHIVSHSANEVGKYYRRAPNHRKAST